MFDDMLDGQNILSDHSVFRTRKTPNRPQKPLKLSDIIVDEEEVG